jgi:actin-related protein
MCMLVSYFNEISPSIVTTLKSRENVCCVDSLLLERSHTEYEENWVSLQCVEDVRCELLENVLLLGGTAMMPGLRARLTRELRAHITSGNYSDLSGEVIFVDDLLNWVCLGLQNQIAFMQSPYGVNYLGWLGGSVMGSLDSSVTNGLSKDNYHSKLARIK